MQRAVLIIDLGFGDSGKGTMVDCFARQEGRALVVRFNGGPQAGHNVVTPDGRHHTFSQFGAGTLAGADTLLSRFLLIEPYALLNEAAHLVELGAAAPLRRLFIDARCPVITPAHQAANRLREIARGAASHGTCGMGVGELMADRLTHPERVLHAGELRDRAAVLAKLRYGVNVKRADLAILLSRPNSDPRFTSAAQTLRDPSWIEAAADNYAAMAEHVHLLEPTQVNQMVRNSYPTLIFEGAQGMLLDESFGFHPHTTWSDCTFANAELILDEAGFEGERQRWGALRTYATRHGAGPLMTHDPQMSQHLPEPHNSGNGWQGAFRVGPFDAVAARYALAACGGVHRLALTHVDRIERLPSRICVAYEPGDGSADAACDLRPAPPDDLAARHRLTEALGACRPRWAPIDSHHAEAFIKEIERQLDKPVAIISHGPTASDKRIREAKASGRRV